MEAGPNGPRSEFDLGTRILHRDANLLILDKPAGLPVHPGPRARSSVESLAAGLTFGLRHAPIPAHRIDQDTSGCLVLARHPKARTRLGRLFEARRIGKVYWAVVDGQPAAESGTIDLTLRKAISRDGWRILADPGGEWPAATEWRVLARGDRWAWLELRPLTGRTHQLRVHLAAQGWPILGDSTYGTGHGPMWLHARRVEVPYWEGRAPIVAEAEPPDGWSRQVRQGKVEMKP